MSSRTARPVTRFAANALGLVVLLACVFPVYWMVSSSFLPRKEITGPDPHWVPTGGTLDNYRRLFDVGQIEDASQSAEYADVLQQEADLTAGHGVLRYTGLIAISAPSVDELDAAVAAIEQAAIQASCETRLLVGQQAQAFVAAALPLGRGL